jgi:putative Holliday junction resolvase
MTNFRHSYFVIRHMRVMALDAGERRIGVALSDPTQTIARALTIVERRSKAEDFERLRRLIAEHEVERVVVGYPRSLSGEEGPQARRVARWAEALRAALPVPVELWDEQYSTVVAEEVLRERGERRGAKRRRLDDVAAAVILQEYLDARGYGHANTAQ